MFSEKLKQARLMKKMTLEEVVTCYNEQNGASMTSATLSRYENGKQEPTVSVVAGLCRVLGASADHLLETGNDRISRIPILEGADSFGEDEKELVAAVVGWEEVALSAKEAKDMIAIRSQSVAMQPRIQKGDVILAMKNVPFESGDLVLLAVKGGSVFCRRVYFTDDAVIFAAESGQTPPIFYTSEEAREGAFTIVGKVVEIRSRLGIGAEN